LQFTKTREEACVATELTKEKIAEKVFGIVAEQLQVPKEDIANNKSFIKDLQADSLDIVELVMEFEDEFKIGIPDEDYEKIQTVGDAVKYIEEKSGT
jgi:acyl carrier protein